MVSYFSVNKKESKTVLELPQLPPHLPLHPVPEKKKKSRKKEMKSLNLIMNKKNTLVLQELEDLEAHSWVSAILFLLKKIITTARKLKFPEVACFLFEKYIIGNFPFLEMYKFSGMGYSSLNAFQLYLDRFMLSQYSV